MTDDVVLKVSNLSKIYQIYNLPQDRLKQSIYPRLQRLVRKQPKQYFREFWALKDVSFELKRGEALGIIGRNGSGKSTILQIIAGTLTPTCGTVEATGKIAALLELGSGFNPEFTGRENAYMNGMILGFSKSEMDGKIDKIVEFADIGEFIDQPVKTYSSGMYVRLAFAVQVCTNPEILIVDEALSVGDVFFQQKCFTRVREMLKSGTTLLFVSHDTAAVQNLCNQAILLHRGTNIFQGSPEEATSRYYTLSSISPDIVSENRQIIKKDKTNKPAAEYEELLNSHNIKGEARSEHGAGDLLIDKVAFLNEDGVASRTFRVGARLIILLELHARREIADPSTGLHLYDRMNNLIFAAGTRQLRIAMPDFAAEETRIVRFNLDLEVQPGEYTISVGCGQPSDDGPNTGVAQHRLEGLGPITVIPVDDGVWPFYGMARLPMSVSIEGR